MQWIGMIPAGKVEDRPVIALDIFPTAMAAAGIDKSPGEPLDGVNLLPYLTGKNSGRPHDVLYWKSNETWAVREGNLKLTVPQPVHRESPKLFDLAKDISECRYLAAERPEDVKRLRALYEAWKATHKPTQWGPNATAQ
jgi:arylsulfatase A-like enzyme